MGRLSVALIAAVPAVAFTHIAFAADMPVKAPVQDTKQIGTATVTIGSGIAMLALPGTGSLVTRGPNDSGTDFPVLENFNFSDDFDNRVGWNINGSIAVPIGAATVSLSGFWAQIKGNSSFTCSPATTVAAGDLCVVTPLVDDPTRIQVNGVLGPGNAAFGGLLATNSERKVDHWGAALESKWALNRVMGMSSAYHLAVGADIRGIYQNLDATMASTATNTPTFLFVDTYGESLDTTYYGAYLAFGGNLPPFLPWGLQSSFRLQGGIYYAHTSYDGQLTNSGPIIGGGGDPTSALSLSRNDTAFIGGVALEIGKKITERATLSLKGEYEYYSFVPQMIYNTADQSGNPFLTGRQFGTLIDSADASALRASLRLTIGFGP